MKKICVLTEYNSYDPAYSLIAVTETHISMMLKDGYEPVVVVMEGFTPGGAFADPRVKLITTPGCTKSNDGILPAGWRDEVEKLSAIYDDILKENEIDFVMTHDLISQPASLIPNLAARKAAVLNPNVGWGHMVHSVFSSNVQSNILEASKEGRARWPTKFKVLFPNAADIPRVARAFNVEEDDVVAVPHGFDIAKFFGFHPVLERLADKVHLFSKDVIMCYPCRLDAGKQAIKVLEIVAALRRIGLSAFVLFGDFHSTGGEKLAIRQAIHDRAKEHGLDENDYAFLSEQDPQFKHQAPHEVIRQFMSVCNVFCLPSVSETFSLVALEAGLTGSFVMLNRDFPVMRSVFGNENPKYFPFSSNMDALSYMDGQTNTRHDNEMNFYEDIAKYVRYELATNRILRQKTELRKKHNLRTAFKTWLEPLFHM